MDLDSLENADWYSVANVAGFDSPALLVYPNESPKTRDACSLLPVARSDCART